MSETWTWRTRGEIPWIQAVTDREAVGGQVLHSTGPQLGLRLQAAQLGPGPGWSTRLEGLVILTLKTLKTMGNFMEQT